MPDKNHLIGMVSGYMEADLEPNLLGLAQNADLAVVVPMDAINETVQGHIESRHQV